MKEVLMQAKTQSKTLIVLGCRLCLLLNSKGKSPSWTSPCPENNSSVMFWMASWNPQTEAIEGEDKKDPGAATD